MCFPVNFAIFLRTPPEDCFSNDQLFEFYYKETGVMPERLVQGIIWNVRKSLQVPKTYPVNIFRFKVNN